MNSQAVPDTFYEVTGNSFDDTALRLFNSLSTEIYLLDAAEYSLVRANKGAQKGCGYTHSVLQDLPIWKLAPELTSARCRELFNPLISGEKDFVELETDIRREDGSRYPVSINFQYFGDLCPPVIVASAHDETEKRKIDDLNGRLGRIVETSLNEIYIFDKATGNFVHVNRGALLNLGFSMDEMKSRTAWDIEPEIEEPGFWDLVRPLIDGDREVLKFETVYQRKDMTRYPVEVHLQLLAEEKPPVFVAIIMDVSERKESERRISKSDRNFSEAQRIAHIGSWHWDLLADDLEWSDEMCRIFGHEPDAIEATSELFFNAIHPDDSILVKRHIEVAMKTGSAYSVEHRVVLPDHGIRWVHEQGEVTFDERGTPVSMLGTALDITERRRVEELNNRFGRIFESSLEEIYIFDGETCEFIHVNQGARRNLSYSMEEMEEMAAWDIQHEIDQPLFRAIVRPLLEGEENVLVFETVHQRKNGTCYPVEVHLQLFEDETPKVFVAIILDISERKEVEDHILSLNQDLETRVERRTADLEKSNEELNDTLEDLKEMQRQLIESEKMASVGGLVAGIAHEINTPVGIGVTAISHLKDQSENIEQAYHQGTMKKSDLEAYIKSSNEAARIAETNLRRASDLIRSFKNVAVDQMSEVPREFGLAEYLDEVFLSLNPKLKQGGHKVDVECDPSIQIFGQPGAFSQIITNLVMNALIHAYEEGDFGHMSLTCKRVGGEIEMQFSDSGKGIPAENVSKVFDPFFTTRRGQGGSGLGLHIIYNLVTQQLGGTIRCESEVGQGTIFTIKFAAR